MMMMVVKMVWVDASHPLLHRIKPKELDFSKSFEISATVHSRKSVEKYLNTC